MPIATTQHTDPKAIEAALCISAGLAAEQVADDYSEATMDRAVSAGYRGWGLSTLLAHVAASAGSPHTGRTTTDSIRAAFEAERTLQASGASTVSLSGILGNVANKLLLAAYKAVPDVTEKFAGVGSNADFKPSTRYRLTADGTMQPVGADGRLKHISLQESNYAAQLDTEGAVMSLTRKMLIDDDLGALNRMARVLGRLAAQSKQKAVFTTLLDNSDSFFSTANKNLVSSNALSIGGLTAGEQKFYDQTDDNGEPLLATPAVLLVPTSLKVLADSLHRETRVNETTAPDTKSTADNPHAGKFDPVTSPYLNAQNIAGSSATSWYLFGDPADVAAMEITYLNNRREPFIESAQLDFDQLGVQWRAYHDFGVSKLDPRGAVKSTA